MAIKTIFHIDLDAFFASCEIALNPSLKDKPFVVAGPIGHSVIGCASYEARKLGIKAGVSTSIEKQKHPEMIIVNGRYEVYEKMSQQFFDFISDTYTNQIEILSIDECWIDVTNLLSKFNNDPIKLATKLQKDIMDQLSLSASIGIAHTKFLAKMATDLNKPFGITTILTEKELHDKLWSLPVEDIFGVGPKTVPKLKALNINTIGQLAQYDDPLKLKYGLKKNWFTIQRNCQGYGDNFVDSKRYPPKSISCSHTLIKPSSDISVLEKQLLDCATEIEKRLKEQKMEALSLGVIYKIEAKPEFKNDVYVNYFEKTQDIFDKALNLLNQYWDKSTPIKLLGIAVSKLHDKTEIDPQMRLW